MKKVNQQHKNEADICETEDTIRQNIKEINIYTETNGDFVVKFGNIET